jgi:hypothetical protein
VQDAGRIRLSKQASPARLRFVAPARTAVTKALIDQPVFGDLAEFRHLLSGPTWPSLDQLNELLQPLPHALTGQALRLQAQEALDDGDNYEQRIFHHGLIATRSGNWHDLLNALVWKQFPAIKSALNAGQVEDMQRIGLQQRTRRQCAFTQFDEAGAVVLLRDANLLAAWDRHDWDTLFRVNREAWRDGRITLKIFGHALYEHALNLDMLLVSKTLVIVDKTGELAAGGVDRFVADAISAGHCLGDPQDLRPLPISGIPGWHHLTQDVGFYREQPCFRPVRAGRRYPPPLQASRA